MYGKGDTNKCYNNTLYPYFLPNWILAISNQSALLYHKTGTNNGGWSLTHASLDTCKANQPHLFTQGSLTHSEKNAKMLSALFCIHSLTDAHNLLVLLWLTGRKIVSPYHPECKANFALLAPGHGWLWYLWDSNLVLLSGDRIIFFCCATRELTQISTLKFTSYLLLLPIQQFLVLTNG